MSAPLAGIRVLEFAGLAPVPFCGKVLSDFGADVIRVDRCKESNFDYLAAGKRSIAIDLDHPASKDVLIELIKRSDILLDPYRPDVLLRKGFSDAQLQEINPRLIIAHLTGWGSTGPLAHTAGHDLNYLSITGILSTLGRADSPPIFPQNLLADFAGGSLICALGVVMALYKRAFTGKGDIIDSAMLDGTIYLASFIFQTYNTGLLSSPRGRNLLDSGAYFYEIYSCKDSKFLAVACLEPKFFHNFIETLIKNTESSLRLYLDKANYMAKETWPVLKAALTEIFKTKTRDEWTLIFEGADNCVSPVLDIEEAARHPQNIARSNFLSTSPLNPAPAPKLKNSPALAVTTSSYIEPGRHTEEIMRELNIDTNLMSEVLLRLHSPKL